MVEKIALVSSLITEKGCHMKDINKYRGCLIGGAVGDALGYAVEFMQDYEIFEKYGTNGITEYSLVNNLAYVSDDTQMTLFTANGLLLGTTREKIKGEKNSYLHYISLCYKDWLKTQTAEDFGFESPEFAWLNYVPEMNHSREPGQTCIYYLMHNNLGTTTDHKNNSKGCGGIMRVAPIGLYFENKGYTLAQIDMMGAEAAALTHGHELGYIPAAMLVHIIHLLAHNTDMSVLDAVKDAQKAITALFPYAKHVDKLIDLTNTAIQLALSHKILDIDAIRKLGEGWVAEETLAIAIFCAIKYEHNFEKAMIASVNHSGDSDSTGSVTGNILGAHLGIQAIPQKFLNRLELKDTILEIADDLFYDYQISEDESAQDTIWAQKYIYHTYLNKK